MRMIPDDGHGDEDERVKSRMVMITVQRTTKAVTGMLKTQIYISSEEKFNAKRCGTRYTTAGTHLRTNEVP